MAQSINLVPQEEVTEQKKSKLVRFSTVFSVILLIAVSGIGAFLIYQKNTLQAQVDALDSEVGTLRSDINSLSAIEVTARNLDQKYQVLGEMFDTRQYYSLLLEEVRTRTPDNVKVGNFNIDEASIDLNGEGSDYISVATFMNNLLDKNFEGGDPNLNSLFTSVSLNSVSLKGKEGGVTFVIVVSFDPAILKR